jgi:O-acetylhomoserine/O-acetylserine sulfhydrylase
MQLKPAVLLSSLLASLASPILAAKPTIPETTVTLRIPPSPPVLANPHLLPPSTHATLTTLGKALSAPLSTANTFVFHNVTPGSYLVDVHCPTHGFAPLRLDVVRPTEDEAREGVVGGGNNGLRVRAWETYRGNDWGNKGEAVPVREGGVLDVRVHGQKGYFVERSSCSFFLLLFLALPQVNPGWEEQDVVCVCADAGW